ncbi:efflux RND transporter periplasmic adaptor subunit [Rhodoligotrophos ferricapiens]|uniref:efflux RND transporter periplasmic adaptor subunit n=1 Tax=Rhodoligotrophos ferricapiens TaxID=3069264 RepID=UPI00315D2911
MPSQWTKRLAFAAAAAAILAGVAWFAWPKPIPVDLATVVRGPMEVTVDEEGKTRIGHIYSVSAPIAGRVLRISPPRHVGDEVAADEVVAVMQPLTPSFHDARTHQELVSALAAADAAVGSAEAEVRRIEASLRFTRTELDRAQALARTQAISSKALDKAKFDAEANDAALASAKAQLEVRRNERATVAARVEGPDAVAGANTSCCIQLRAPVAGRILRIIQDSEGVVAAGAPLLEIGNHLDLEVVADLLSTDAVRIRPGASVVIDGWGGEPLRGSVLRVDPAGFVKVSALGIEEQRVRTTINFTGTPEARLGLGHDFRVLVHIVAWRSEDALMVPLSALYRTRDEWSAFVVKDGRARPTIVKIGQRNGQVAQVLSGLSPTDRVVLHPSDRVRDGVRVAEREQ